MDTSQLPEHVLDRDGNGENAIGQHFLNFQESQNIRPVSEYPADISVSIIPHIEIPSVSICQDFWIDSYRALILNAIKTILIQVEIKSLIVVGVKDIHVTSTHQSTTFIPLSILVLEDITASLSAELKIKDFFVLVPSGNTCDSGKDFNEYKSKIKANIKNWESETNIERTGMKCDRKKLPIIHANYFVLEKIQ